MFLPIKRKKMQNFRFQALKSGSNVIKYENVGTSMNTHKHNIGEKSNATGANSSTLPFLTLSPRDQACKKIK